MTTTTLKDVIDRTKTTLQEITTEGIRWKNEELLMWANDFYRYASSAVPGEFSHIREFSCVAGTLQNAPADIVQILDVMRNLDGNKAPVIRTEKNVLDSTRRDWHSETETMQQEAFITDPRHLKAFYVWPPASVGSKLEIMGVVVPVAHDKADLSDEAITIKCDDRLAPAMVDYILFRAFQKDSDATLNAERAATHFQIMNASLGLNPGSK